MVSLLIDFLAQIVTMTISQIGYVGIFVLMLLESCGVPLPSEVIMPFSGFVVAEGKMLFWLVVLCGTIGNLVGSWIAYWIGFSGGRPLIEKYGKYLLISKHDLNLADKWFTRYGDWVVFFGRLLPVVRTYISFPAGIAEMNFKKFSYYTFVGAFIWTTLFAWLGVGMGSNWEVIRQKLHSFDLVIVIVLVVLFVLYLWRHLKLIKK
ncbi:MAG TPA: DedA family protein [Patescibacteria group bacterium]|nr:DedA family protein [Patescibacteria group bacterium]